jgi:hypothetical protein
MRNAILAALTTVTLSACAGEEPVAFASLGRYEVFGVEGDDMLKMRAGPGIGYVVTLGLPNGTGLWVYDCQPTGGTRWCSVSLEEARAINGHVSWAYLRRM